MIAPIHPVAEAGLRANCGRPVSSGKPDSHPQKRPGKSIRRGSMRSGLRGKHFTLKAISFTRMTSVIGSRICCVRKRTRCSLPSGVTGSFSVAGSSRGSAGRLAIGSAVGAAFRSQQTLAPGRNFRADRCRCGSSWPCRNRGSLAARDRRPSGCSGHLDGVQSGPPGTSLVLGVTNKDLTSEKSRVGVRGLFPYGSEPGWEVLSARDGSASK